ncbi:hypothetical protein FHR81_001742 [Actinoalloteichus hoggarensis]|uniref:Uncharacterized protein n=1 Tax=Actinoalloteichus hoggarensis TaxID=1470176 RepID=A0A221W4S9_9PSEU|nr:DUF1707 domain-containing protein [Actinoalloteichus hoggarensis]ASO20774.1 hypothetical protein AHOG_15740 [Actinoalloteichus hoggarensis]MBB5920704.1 hypothetical protein [Actinoalloteichus hoggarensis]
MEDEQIEVRIGDRERRSVDARLRAALDDGVLTLTEYDERTAKCWAARTREDLRLLTRDLPEPAAQADDDGTPSAAPQPAARTTAPAKSDEDECDDEQPGLVSRMVSAVVTGVLVVAGGFLGWQVISSDDGAAVFGRQTVHVGEGQESVEVGALLGRVEIIVPEGVRARPSGTLFFGRTDCEQACAADAGAEEITVDVTGAFARVDVLTQQEYAQDDRDDD